MSKTHWMILTTVFLTSFLSAQVPDSSTVRQATPTTIRPYSQSHKPGVPGWVYNSRVPAGLRMRFEVLYQMKYERLRYQSQRNLERLANLLGDIGSSGAIGVKNQGVPEWVWHLDDSDQVRWLQDRIRQNVRQHDLGDIALSEDLVPSLRPARPTTIRPTPRSKQLQPEEVQKILVQGAKEAAKEPQVDAMEA